MQSHCTVYWDGLYGSDGIGSRWLPRLQATCDHLLLMKDYLFVDLSLVSVC